MKLILKKYTMFNINKLMLVLKEKNKIFCSEKHLQTIFGYEVLKQYNDCVCIPEYPLIDSNNGRTKHLDLLIKVNNKKIGIEFKYIVKKYKEVIDGVEYNLRNHSALDIRRYDCLKDISRLEALIEAGKIDDGYFLLITNDSKLWENINNNETSDKEFRFYDGGKITAGKKKWQNKAKSGTTKNRNKELVIHNEYNVGFKEYSKLNPANGSNIFKYLLIEIKHTNQ